MHESLVSLYRQYWEGSEKKEYYAGFVMLTERVSKRCKSFAPSLDTSSSWYNKRNTMRVYMEVRGCSMIYWEAGHCDTDPGTVGAKLEKFQGSQDSHGLISCEAGFTEEERDPANQKSYFLCFAFFPLQNTHTS